MLDAVHRIARQLKRFGYADPDDGGKPDADDPALSGLVRAAIQGRQWTGVEAGRQPAKVRSGLTVPRPNGKNGSDYAGFSLHAKHGPQASKPEIPRRICVCCSAAPQIVAAGAQAKCRRKKLGEVGQRETSTRLRWS